MFIEDEAVDVFIGKFPMVSNSKMICLASVPAVFRSEIAFWSWALALNKVVLFPG